MTLTRFILIKQPDWDEWLTSKYMQTIYMELKGFYIIPDKAFLDCWVNHKKRPSISHGHAAPILSAMQGHPKLPCLWEKHADLILREVGFTPITHEPCLYTGVINGSCVIFLQQVDDFVIALLDSKTSEILLDLLDKWLTIPIKCQGYLNMYNRINATQMWDYIKISCKSYINKCCKKHLVSWMSWYMMVAACPTSFLCDPTLFK
jgi:hypothetical protein